MLQYATYSVISPEGCASILWKSATHAPTAAEAMGMTAQRLHQLGLVDEIIGEPLGGAHRDAEMTAQAIRKSLARNLDMLRAYGHGDSLLNRRYSRLMKYGHLKTA